MAFSPYLSLRFATLCGALFAILMGAPAPLSSAQKPAPMYRNPILFADYSDPEVIRAGSDYYFVRSPSASISTTLPWEIAPASASSTRARATWPSCRTQADPKLVFSNKDQETAGPALSAKVVQLRGMVVGDMATYACSTDDGAAFKPIGPDVKLAFGWWKGARPAVFAFNTDQAAKTNGFVDIDWVRYRAASQKWNLRAGCPRSRF